MNSLAPIRRLHIGAASPQHLSGRALHSLVDETWLHLGDYDEQLSNHSMVTVGDLRLFQLRLAEHAHPTYYMPFWYDSVQGLPFDDRSFSLIFSEHFFEHLFLDQACELFKECFRVLMPNGCFRIVVPDADLRTYLAPEPLGFTTDGDRWIDPGKHKTRWCFYSLRYLLNWCGFDCAGIVYCDREGNYINRSQGLPLTQHSNCLEGELLTSTRYILRLNNSLVVDAVRHPS